MKKINLVLLLMLAFGSLQAQTNYYGTDWQRDKLFNVVLDIMQPVSGNYSLSGVNMYDWKTNAYYEFLKSDGNTIRFDLRNHFVGIDKDLGIKGKPILNEMIIEGFLPDLYKVYKRMNPTVADLETVKVKGSSPVLEMPNKIAVAFYRSSDANGYWAIRMRKD